MTPFYLHHVWLSAQDLVHDRLALNGRHALEAPCLAGIYRKVSVKYQLLEEAHDIDTGKLPIFLHLACDSCFFKQHQQNSLGYIQKES